MRLTLFSDKLKSTSVSENIMLVEVNNLDKQHTLDQIISQCTLYEILNQFDFEVLEDALKSMKQAGIK